MSDTCVKCGAPRDNHPYRHPFVGHRPADAPLTPAKAMALCPEVAALVECAREAANLCANCGFDEMEDDLHDAIAPFTEGTDG